MAFGIVRLVVTSWPEALEALRERGVDFYRTTAATNGHPASPALATEYKGALALTPASRDFDARSWYQVLQPRLPPEARRACDEHFGALFWNGEEDTRLADLGAAGLPTDDSAWQWRLWTALAPARVEAQVELARRLPVAALAAAAEEGGPKVLQFLPSFRDFEGHLGHHREQLVYARNRDAGLLAIASF
jgi:hypothetical protein